jgi:hypothetical protein
MERAMARKALKKPATRPAKSNARKPGKIESLPARAVSSVRADAVKGGASRAPGSIRIMGPFD